MHIKSHFNYTRISRDNIPDDNGTILFTESYMCGAYSLASLTKEN